MEDDNKTWSPWSPWNLPERDMSDIKKAVRDEHYEFCCPYCGEKLPWMEEYSYTVDGKEYPQIFNEFFCDSSDGTIHDYDEVYCCPKCKKESYFRGGCF